LSHWEGDFDFRRYLSHIFSYVTNILICFRIGDPEAPLLVCMKGDQKLEEHIKVEAGLYLQDTLGHNIGAYFLDHHVDKVLLLFIGSPFPDSA